MPDKKKILLVEDEADLQKLYAYLLESPEYDTKVVGDGQAALEEMRVGGYDLVLLDVMLPEIDGIQILNTITEDKNYRQQISRIVVLTNLSQEALVIQAVDMGVRGYMVKSDYNPDQFREAVIAFLDK